MLLGVGALLVLACAGIYVSMSAALLDQFDDTLVAKTEALVAASEIDEDGFEIDLVIQDFADFGPLGSDYFEMFKPDGGPLARSPSLGRTSLLPMQDLEWGDLDVRTRRLDDGRRLRIATRTFRPKDDTTGEYDGSRLVVATPLAPLDRLLRVLAVVLAAVGAGGLILLVPIVARGLVTGLVPLTRFNEQIAAWDGTTTLRFDRARLPDELVPMAVALEGSADRIERAFARERRFGANAAHELRTPLAEIRAMAELVSRWPEEAGRAPEIVEIVDRMSARLAQLAELSRAEHASLDSTALDLRTEVQAALDARAEQAAKRRLQFDVSLSESYITSDGTAVRAIVDNVIGNAVAHAPEGSMVTVRLDGTELEVRNPAPQLQPADIPRLFERFWRPAGAGHDERHSGLGLSLVAMYAEATGAEARAALEQGDLVLTVRWSEPR